MQRQTPEVNNAILEILVSQPKTFMVVEIVCQIVIQTLAGYIIVLSLEIVVLLTFQHHKVVICHLAQAFTIAIW
jgi:hypothetical protein